MDKLYNELHVYLNMEEEISLAEFDTYYKRIIEYFNGEADNFDEEKVWKALFISENVMSNADARAKSSKKTESKKFKKMAQRMSLWAQNFTARLAEMGYSQDEMNERFEKMFDDKVE